MSNKKTPGKPDTVIIDGRPWTPALVATKRKRIKEQIAHLEGNLVDLDRIDSEIQKKLKQ